jgi:hypothetical protein
MHSRSHQTIAGMIGSQHEPEYLDKALFNEVLQTAKGDHPADVAVSSHPATRSPYRNPVVIKKRASKFFPEFFAEQ